MFGYRNETQMANVLAISNSLAKALPKLPVVNLAPLAGFEPVIKFLGSRAAQNTWDAIAAMERNDRSLLGLVEPGDLTRLAANAVRR